MNQEEIDLATEIASDEQFRVIIMLALKKLFDSKIEAVRAADVIRYAIGLVALDMAAQMMTDETPDDIIN